jgi:hypothetical protein
MCDNNIPIANVAVELNVSVHDLRRKANGSIVRDDAGMSYLPRNVVRDMVSEREAELKRHRERKAAQRAEDELARAQREAERQAERDRRAALHAHQRPLIEAGAPALAVMTEANQQARWDRAAETRSDMLPRTREV